jgi:predicted secreted hydrolase
MRVCSLPRQAWLLALALAGACPAAPPEELSALLGAQDASGFAQVLAPRAFSFPADHGPHPLYRQEWWYFTGNLDAADGRRFGFELAFFRYALAAAPPAPQSTSAWRAQQIYMAHFAVSDAAAGDFRFAQKLSRAALGLAGAQAEPLRVWIDDWSVSAAPAAPQAWHLHAAEDGYELDLDLDASAAAPVLNGVGGFSAKSAEPGAASYYYSLPRLAAHGRLVRAGRPLAVSGLAWCDREWGSGGLGAREAGWDWFGLQLQDGSALMFYALRDQGGGRDAHSAGSFIDASGAVRSLTAQEVSIEVLGQWLSPQGVRYPSGWRVRVPRAGLDLTVQPLLADQELRVTPRYWEGAVDVSGARAGEPVAGRGYVELVGYPQER